MGKLTSDTKLKTYLLICLVSLCPFILITVIRNFDILQLIELRTLDARLRLMRVPDVSSDLILITIDDKSQSNEGIGQLPWPPYIYSSLLESLQTAKPAATGLIARFNRDWEGSAIPGDNLFVIQLYTAEDNYPTRIPHIKDWIDLPQMLTNADTVSFSVFPESQSDGIYRSGQLVVFNTQENSLKFSLEILMLCQLHSIPPETIKLKDSIWKGKFLAMKLESGEDIRIPIDAAGRTFPPRKGSRSTSCRLCIAYKKKLYFSNSFSAQTIQSSQSFALANPHLNHRRQCSMQCDSLFSQTYPPLPRKSSFPPATK